MYEIFFKKFIKRTKSKNVFANSKHGCKRTFCAKMEIIFKNYAYSKGYS